MKRSRAQRIYRNHIEPYYGLNVATVNISKYVGGSTWNRNWETIERIPVEPIGVNENGEDEYDNSSVNWSDVKYLNGRDDIMRVLENDTPLYVVPPFLSFGDYDNSSDVERSNHRLFMAEYGGESFSDDYASQDGNLTVAGVHGIYGGYGSKGVLISLETWLRNAEMRELIALLESYPCIDDEDVSRVAMALADEAWTSWVEHGFRSALEKKFGIEEWAEDLSNLRQYFESARESANAYWEVESGGNSFVRIEDVVDVIESLDWEAKYFCGDATKLSDFVVSVEVESE